jgi:hypothetical protein
MTKARDIADLGAVTSRLDTVGASDGALSNRNVLYNASFTVAQRGTSVTGVGVDDYGLDRWKQFASAGGMAGRSTHSQETITDLEGFHKALKIAVTTTETPASTESYALVQRLEAQDTIRFGVGTSNSKPMTLSFYAKANAAITLPAGLRMSGGGVYLNNFNITTSWQRFTLTIPATTDTNMATTGTGTSEGAEVFICLMANADRQTASTETWTDTSHHGASGMGNLFASTSNYLFVTGVQLEVGDTATPFEHRSYGDELARCQRYYFRTPDDSTYAQFPGNMMRGNSDNIKGVVVFPVEMRAKPTASVMGTNGGAWNAQQGDAGIAGTIVFEGIWSDGSTKQSAWCDFGGATNGNEGYSIAVYRNNQTVGNKAGVVQFDAEL